MKFIPNSSLLHHIYVPFYELPIKQILTASDLSLEYDANGVLSIINLSSDSMKYTPFIDASKFDFERKDWFWYDSDGFPYRFTAQGETLSSWTLESVYGVPAVDYSTDSTIIPILVEKTITKELGIYTYCNSDKTEKLYKGVPICVLVQNVALTDVTDYFNPNSNVSLNNINTIINKEFYFDSAQNKILTNQNLAGFSPKDITIGFYTIVDNITVKCRLSANEGTVSEITPIVDYYILKINSQNLRG